MGARPAARGRAHRGHPPDVRTALLEIEDDPAAEVATLAWSYAAARAVGMPLETLFHEGYKANPAGLILSFSMGIHIGLPMLQSWRMAARPGDDAPPFPAMLAWLRPPSVAADPSIPDSDD